MRVTYLRQELPCVEASLRECTGEAAGVAVEDLQEVQQDKPAP